MSGLSEQRLAEIAARAEAASAGPWCTDDWEIYQGTPEDVPHLAKWIGETCRAGDTDGSRTDAEFIAAARTDVPLLLARVAELEAERDAVRGEVADAVMCTDGECLNRHHLPKIAGLLGGVGLVDAPEAGGSRG